MTVEDFYTAIAQAEAAWKELDESLLESGSLSSRDGAGHERDNIAKRTAIARNALTRHAPNLNEWLRVEPPSREHQQALGAIRRGEK